MYLHLLCLQLWIIEFAMCPLLKLLKVSFVVSKYIPDVFIFLLAFQVQSKTVQE